MKEQIRILFVCLGNICRSTMAEAVMRHKVEQAGCAGEIEVDSAGTGGYHIGEKPHEGTRKKLEQHGISWEGIRARKITRNDLDSFDYVVAMDKENLRDILMLANDTNRDKVALLSDFVEGADWVSVPDPWFTGNFEQTYRLVSQGCDALLHQVRE